MIFGVSGWFIYNSTQTETKEKSNTEELKNEKLALWNKVNEKTEKELEKNPELNYNDPNNLIHDFHSRVDTVIIYRIQESMDSEDYKFTRDTFIENNALFVRWLFEKHKFDLPFHEILAKDANYYFEEYARGNEDAIFGLKNVIFELDLERNPDLYKPQRATYLSLSDIERIRNDKEPFGEYFD